MGDPQVSVSTQRLVPYRLVGRLVGPGALNSGSGSSRHGALPVGSIAGASASRGAADAPPVHARNVGEILDIALDVFLQRFWFCAGGSGFLWLCANGFAGRDSSSSEPVSSVMAFTLGVQYLTTAFVVVAVYGELQGRRIDARRAVALVIKRLPALFVFVLPIFAAFQLTRLPTSYLLVAFPAVIAGLLLAAWLLALAPAAIVLENIGPLRAMRRSARLARGALGVWLLLSILQTWLAAPFGALPIVLEDPRGRAALESWIPAAIPLPIADALWLVVRSLFEGVATAFGAVVMAVWYVDRRVRLEGFDLVMRLERLRDRDARRGA